MRAVSVYDPQTGEFTGLQLVTGSDELVVLNTPKGMSVIEGLHNPKTRRVDLSDAQNPKVVEKTESQ